MAISRIVFGCVRDTSSPPEPLRPIETDVRLTLSDKRLIQTHVRLE